MNERAKITASHLSRQAIVYYDVSARVEGLYRSRDASYPAPPAQIRTCPIKAYGSYLEWVTRNRWSGHGCSTRGDGRNRAISRHIRSHVSRCR